MGLKFADRMWSRKFTRMTSEQIFLFVLMMDTYSVGYHSGFCHKPFFAKETNEMHVVTGVVHIENVFAQTTFPVDYRFHRYLLAKMALHNIFCRHMNIEYVRS